MLLSALPLRRHEFQQGFSLVFSFFWVFRIIDRGSPTHNNNRASSRHRVSQKRERGAHRFAHALSSSHNTRSLSLSSERKPLSAQEEKKKKATTKIMASTSAMMTVGGARVVPVTRGSSSVRPVAATRSSFGWRGSIAGASLTGWARAVQHGFRECPQHTDAFNPILFCVEVP